MKAIDIQILQTLFKKHNKMTSKYAWEPGEIIEYERLIAELQGIETVYIENVKEAENERTRATPSIFC